MRRTPNPNPNPNPNPYPNSNPKPDPSPNPSVERAQVDEVDALVEVDDGCVLERAEAAVDAADQLVHLVAQLMVAPGVVLGRRRDLHEHLGRS